MRLNARSLHKRLTHLQHQQLRANPFCLARRFREEHERLLSEVWENVPWARRFVVRYACLFAFAINQ